MSPTLALHQVWLTREWALDSEQEIMWDGLDTNKTFDFLGKIMSRWILMPLVDAARLLLLANGGETLEIQQEQV